MNFEDYVDERNKTSGEGAAVVGYDGFSANASVRDLLNGLCREVCLCLLKLLCVYSHVCVHRAVKTCHRFSLGSARSFGHPWVTLGSPFPFIFAQLSRAQRQHASVAYLCPPPYRCPLPGSRADNPNA